MARRASFGRAPRVAQSLTNTLVAIAREMQSRRDSNLIDAWKGGGMFEGQKATDELVLAHWKMRLAGVSKRDPLWDTYNNAYMQYDYAINESKMSVLHAQKRISDTQAAQFYLNWAKKVPRNSEFWRVLQRDGAQMMERARAVSDTGRREREEAAYDAQQAALGQREKPAQFLVDLMTSLGQLGAFGTSNIIAGPNSTSGYAGQGLGDMDATDPGVMTAFLAGIRGNQFTPEDGGHTDAQGSTYVYTDTNGKAWTSQAIIDAVGASDPTFGGNLTPEYVASVIKGRNDVLDQRISLAESTGHITEASNLSKQKASNVALARQVASYPAEQIYMDTRLAFENALKRPGITPKEVAALDEKYKSDLVDLTGDKSLRDNDFFRNSLLDEANGKGGRTMGDAFASDTGVDGTKNGPPSYSIKVDAAIAELELLERDPQNMQMTQGERDPKTGLFKPKPGGTDFGVASMADIKAASPIEPHIMWVPTASGELTAIMGIGAPVRAEAFDSNGDIVDHSGPTIVGAVFTVPGVDQTFGVTPPKGQQMRFTPRPPWDEARVTGRMTDTGLVLDVSNVLPQVDANGRVVGVLPPGITRKTGKDGGYVIDLTVATMSSDVTRVAAGPNPSLDFASLAVASLLYTPEGEQSLKTLSNDPIFKAQMESDSRKGAGFHEDANALDGSGWSGGDQKTYESLRSAANVAINSGINMLMSNGAWWTNKESTAPAFDKARYDANDGGVGDPKVGFTSELPLDALTGTQFEALGSATTNGTNTLVGKKRGGEDSVFSIKIGKGITVPKLDPKDSSTIINPATTGGSADASAITAAAPTKPQETPPPPPNHGAR